MHVEIHQENSEYARVKPQIMFWLAVTMIFLFLIWLFKGILLPFVLGATIAYLLNPVVEKIKASGLRKRRFSVLAILGGFFIVVGMILAVSLPIISRELVALIERMPDYIHRLWAHAKPYLGWFEQRTGYDVADQIQTAVEGNVGRALNLGQNVLSRLATGGQAIIEFIVFLLLTPITAYYMMMEWPRITSWFHSLVPRDHQAVVRSLLSQIDSKIAGFIRGQFTVCFFIAIMYAVCLTIAGLNYGFLIAFATGLLSIIPYVGSALGLVASLTVAAFQSSGDPLYVGIIAAIFFAGQFIEGNFITPKLMGKSVGLHPLWIIFALMAGGALFGLVGMFLAVPIAAIIGVLSGFAIERYKQSRFFKAAASEKIVVTTDIVV